MKWMRLKVYLLPAIMQEVDSVTETYINLINDLRRHSNRENLNEFMELREEITKRIEEIDNFYEDNIGDSRVVNFEKARIRLKKLLMYDPDLMNRMDQPTEENDFRGIAFGYNNEIIVNQNKTSAKAPNKFQQLSSKNKRDISPVPNEKQDRINNIASKQKSETKSKPAIKNSSNQVNQITNSNQPMNTGRKQQETKLELKLDEIISTNPIKNMNTQTTFNNEEDWKELIFKIKLTEPEYKLLLREKSKLFSVK